MQEVMVSVASLKTVWLELHDQRRGIEQQTIATRRRRICFCLEIILKLLVARVIAYAGNF